MPYVNVNKEPRRPSRPQTSGRCETCRGDGTVLNPGRTDVMVCPECNGAGYLHVCQFCNGTGYLPETT